MRNNGPVGDTSLGTDTAGESGSIGAGDRPPAPGSSSRRLVREPGRGTRAVALVVLGGVIAGVILVALGAGGGNDSREGGDDRRPADPGESYAMAIGRLGRARSFAFSGSVQASEHGLLRPGTWIAPEVHVEGAVLLPLDITRELARVASGEAVRTVTSGPMAWSSTHPTRPDSSWEVVRSPEPQRIVSGRAVGEPPPNRLGIALVANVLRSAGERRSGPEDWRGRRTLRATVPPGEHEGALQAGAEVSLALDEDSDIAHVLLTALPVDDPPLVLDLNIERSGEPGLITPDDVEEPVRHTVALDDLEAARFEPLEPARLPPGWALIEAQVSRAGSMGHCGAVGCAGPPQGCPALALEYRDLRAVHDGWLSLSLASQECLGRSAETPRGEPFRAGSLSGRAEEGDPSRGVIREAINGTVSDGVTRISFGTDLSTADAAAVLGSLVPFDVATGPAEPERVPPDGG